MKCKRFSVAKRDMLLTKLQVMQLSMSQLLWDDNVIDGDQGKHYLEKIQECIDLINSSLCD